MCTFGENALLCKLQLFRSLDSKYADLKASMWYPVPCPVLVPFLQWICPICGPQTRIKTGVALYWGEVLAFALGRKKDFALNYIYIFFPFFLSLFGRSLFYSVPKRLEEEESFAN
jgi:hypothetical protein